jgi:NAD(P)-dependent dehydrogenase (short-subunit alcohol dehydrogenase family)
VRALIFGASGGLATCLADVLLARRWSIDLVSRSSRRSILEQRFAQPLADGTARLFTVAAYADFRASQSYNAYFFLQALFEPKPLVQTDRGRIVSEIEVGLIDPIDLTRSLLFSHSPGPTERRDFCYIGSTSAYAGFKNTSIYCAVKHGLVGFVRAMNEEFSSTDTRFWLFSMGTMNTDMGLTLIDQDPASFLQPEDVAKHIADSICSSSNVFEPEILMRRRKIQFREK